MTPNCKPDITRLLALIDGKLRPAAADQLRKHLASCQSCNAAFLQIQQTKQLCAEAADPQVPDLPYRQIEAQIFWQLTADTDAKQQQVATAGKKFWFPVVGAAVVSGIIGVMAGRMWDSSSPQSAPIFNTTPASKMQARAPQPITPEQRPIAWAAIPTLITGDVRIRHADQLEVPLTLHRPVLANDSIRSGTQSRAVLQWNYHSVLSISDSTSVSIDMLNSRNQQMTLLRGTVAMKATSGVTHLAVVTTHAKFSVVGTLFQIQTTDQISTLDVHEGAVAVSPQQPSEQALRSPTGAWPAIVRAGYRFVIGNGSARLESLPVATVAPHLYVVTAEDENPLTLAAQAFALDVKTRPFSADIVFDQHLVGTTNSVLRTTPGRHLLELWRNGQLIRREWIVVDSPEGNRITWDLAPGTAQKSDTPKLPGPILDLLNEKKVLLRSCYERRLKQNELLQGTLELRIDIDDTGAVLVAKIDKQTLPDPAVGHCVLKTVKDWKFPSGYASRIIYPLAFKPH